MIASISTATPLELCGICEEAGGGDIYWPTHQGKFTHSSCYQQIQPLESDLNTTIFALFDGAVGGYYFLNEAHKKAIQAVRLACHPDTLLSYLQKNGDLALTRLFNTVGSRAARMYALQYPLPNDYS